MASVNDIGAITDPLSAPLFGGGAGWAAAVRDVLNGSDVTVNARIASHAAAADPHPQYLQTATADSRYSLLAHTHPGVYDPAGTAAASMSAHTAAADPHPQYLTAAEAAAPSSVAAVDVSLAAGAVGTAVEYARGDHVHKIPSTTNAPNAVSAASGAAGTSANVARHDHTHRVSVANPVALGAAIAQGTSNDLARADHVHPFPTAANVGAEAAGAVAAHAGAADPHTGYVKKAGDTVNGDLRVTGQVIVGGMAAAYLEVSGGEMFVRDYNMDTLTQLSVADPQYPSSAATKKYVDDRDAAHAAAADPHTGYQLESEKGAVNGYAGLGADGKVPSEQLPPIPPTSPQVAVGAVSPVDPLTILWVDTTASYPP